jgi:hypothetical protein
MRRPKWGGRGGGGAGGVVLTSPFINGPSLYKLEIEPEF